MSARLHRLFAGESQDNLMGGGVENVNFSWQEIVRFGAFWQPALFLAGNRMTTVAFEREIFLKA